MNDIFQSLDCISQEELMLYQTGKLEGAARHRVENHLLDCPLCNEAALGDTEMDLNSLHDKIDARVAPQHQARYTTSRFWFLNRIAAAILILIVMGGAWFYYQNGPNALPPGSGDLALRGVAKSMALDSYPDGVKLYDTKNYQASLTYFEQALTKTPESALASFYAGLSSWEIGDLAAAENYFKVARFNNEKIYEEASWSLVQLYQRQGKTTEAKRILNDLLKLKDDFYRERAQKLLKELSAE